MYNKFLLFSLLTSSYLRSASSPNTIVISSSFSSCLMRSSSAVMRFSSTLAPLRACTHQTCFTAIFRIFMGTPVIRTSASGTIADTIEKKYQPLPTAFSYHAPSSRSVKVKLSKLMTFMTCNVGCRKRPDGKPIVISKHCRDTENPENIVSQRCLHYIN